MKLKIIRGYMNLGRTRRLSVRAVGRTENHVRRETTRLALKNLCGAIWSLRLLPGNIADYLNNTGLLSLRPGEPLLRVQFAGEIRRRLPSKETSWNPLKDAGYIRESETYLLSSPRLRSLQGHIIATVWDNWFGLKVSGKQAAVLGSYSNAASLSRGLMKAGGINGRAGLSREDKKRMEVVLEPYVRNMDLRRAHLEGLRRPGRVLLAALSQKKRLGRLRRSGFASDKLEVLYPDLIDIEALRHRRQAVVSLKKKYIRKIRVRSEIARFENYMHLQTLIMGAPNRFTAAIERRQV